MLNCTNWLFATGVMSRAVVDSRKSVSCGESFWNTTRWMDDLPLLRGRAGGGGGPGSCRHSSPQLRYLRGPMNMMVLFVSAAALPSA